MLSALYPCYQPIALHMEDFETCNSWFVFIYISVVAFPKSTYNCIGYVVSEQPHKQQ